MLQNRIEYATTNEIINVLFTVDPEMILDPASDGANLVMIGKSKKAIYFVYKSFTQKFKSCFIVSIIDIL